MINVKLFRAPRYCSLADMESANRDHPYTKLATGWRAAVLNMAVALVLVMAMSAPLGAGAQETGSAGGTKAPPSAKPRKMEPEKVPTNDIKAAYLSFRQDKTPQLTETFYLLKVHILWMTDDVIESHRRYIAAERWPARFRALFERGVAWKRAMDKLSPAAPYRSILRLDAITC